MQMKFESLSTEIRELHSKVLKARTDRTCFTLLRERERESTRERVEKLKKEIERITKREKELQDKYVEIKADGF